MTYNYQQTDLSIYKAVLRDDWDSIRNTFEEHPELRTKPITRRLETPLMIAVGTNCSHGFVEKLVSSLTVDLSHVLAARNYQGDTVLHYAAKVGNLIDAVFLVDRSRPEIALLQNNKGGTPLIFAAWLGRKEMLQFLLSMTGVLNLPTSPIPSESLFHGDLLTPVIDAGFLDLALRLVETHANTVLRNNWHSQRALQVLASKPELFPSGRKLGFWGHLIYSLLPLDESKVIYDEKMTSQQHAQDEEAIYMTKEFSYSKTSTVWFKMILQYLASPIKNIYDIKTTHQQTKLLVNRICEIVIEKPDQDVAWTILGSTIATAVGCGNYEVIEECILAYPTIIWSVFEGFCLFHSAIKQRREQVYNLVYQMSSYKAFVASHIDDETKENALHIAAKLAPPHRLNIITGAALQMQRELQWFKEIETFVEPSYKESVNKDGKTPRMVFSDEHKELLKEGQEWMKDTASSSTVVAALIVTMAFAAVFTVPGGNEDKGNPVYLDKGAFMLFIISDAIALFSSATSVLMFLGILTSRYAENDFLYSLPKRMTIGLVSLFLSLAATMIAFSATLALVLQDKVKWIAAPLVIITSIPICLFGMLQFRLLWELVYSTYGPSIFHKQNNRMIH